jgi:hypothetical protein
VEPKARNRNERGSSNHSHSVINTWKISSIVWCVTCVTDLNQSYNFKKIYRRRKKNQIVLVIEIISMHACISQFLCKCLFLCLMDFDINPLYQNLKGYKKNLFFLDF